MKIKNMMLWVGAGLLASSAAIAHPPPSHGYHGGHHAPARPHFKPGPPPHAPAWGHKPQAHYHAPAKYVHYKRGDRLPTRYMSNRYYVNDWRARHLHAPPRGHRWVEVDGRYILAAVATGVIASVFLGY